MSQNNEKRQRGKNFSLNEEYLLVDLVEIHKSVLENKKSDAVTWRQKNETWEKLASEFASQSGVQRTWKALRDKYENLKRKSKVEIAAEKRETYRTGGGPTATSIVSNITEKISCLIGESATGLCNPYDNDGLNTELESKTEDVNDSIQELQSKTDDINDFIQEEFVNLIETDEEVDKEIYPSSSSKWNPTKLKEKVSSKLNTKKYNQRKTKLEDEKIKLIKLQQDFYMDENARAAEKHKLEMEKYQNEITSIRLKNELIQNEIKEKKQRI